MGHDVFISYARRSAKLGAQRLRDSLAQAELTVFLDEREIPFGAAFPGELARGLLDARVTVVFADEAYFERPWCVHELRLLTAAYRAGEAAALSSVVVALPSTGDLAAVTAQLPPPLAAASWPSVAQPEALTDVVRVAVGVSDITLRQRLASHNDDTTERMLSGADLPLAWSDAKVSPSQPIAPLWSTGDAPAPRGEEFIGRAAELWRLVHECASARAFTPARTVLVRGLGGCGKSLLAAEFVARYGRRFFPAGVVWIDCEGGPEELLARYTAIWRQIAPGELLPDRDSTEPKERLATLGRALGDRLRAGTVAGELLWVIDGLPEPIRGEVSGLAAWCPALHHVSVLATTRRADTLRDADATLALGPLDKNAAVALLTRPPVDPRWMTADEWKAVAHWVGELPLVLAVLRESVIDGAISIETLRASPTAEPAEASERLMGALRGEVDDVSLRGAAEAFELSWQALANEPSLSEAASQLALMAPVPLGEPLLAAVITEAHVGKLLRRGWLQAAQGAANGQRAFALHRVPASVLRLKIVNSSTAFAGLFEGFAKLVESNPGAPLNRLDLHLNVAMKHLVRMRVVAGPDLVAAVRRFTQAATRLTGSEQRGLRYLAAAAAHAFGDDEAFAVTLASVTDNSEGSQAAIPHVLQPLKDSSTAVRWIARLLDDSRDAVRWQAVVHAGPLGADELATPLLQAILRDAHVDHTVSFSPYLESGSLRTSLSALADAMADGNGTMRQRAATLVGRALALHGSGLKAGGFHADLLVQRLVTLALTDDDHGVREAAADAAGQFFAPSAWERLSQAVTSGDATARLRGITAAAHYLKAATAPRAPRSDGAEFDDEGGVRFSLQFGEAAEPLPDNVIETLIAWVLELLEPEASTAAATLASLQQGLAACAPWVHERLDQKMYGPVNRLAEALVEAKPDFVNGWWWRGQSRAGLGEDSGAFSDFEVVIRMAPTFTDAKVQLGEALLRLGRQHFEHQQFDPAVPYLLRACEILPERFEGHHLAALSLYNLQRHDEAEAAATRAIGIAPQVGEAWFFRAAARYAAGRSVGALADIRQASTLSPDDERISAFKDELESWFRRNDPHFAD